MSRKGACSPKSEKDPGYRVSWVLICRHGPLIGNSPLTEMQVRRCIRSTISMLVACVGYTEGETASTVHLIWTCGKIVIVVYWFGFGHEVTRWTWSLGKSSGCQMPNSCPAHPLTKRGFRIVSERIRQLDTCELLAHLMRRSTTIKRLRCEGDTVTNLRARVSRMLVRRRALTDLTDPRVRHRVGDEERLARLPDH